MPGDCPAAIPFQEGGRSSVQPPAERSEGGVYTRFLKQGNRRHRARRADDNILNIKEIMMVGILATMEIAFSQHKVAFLREASIIYVEDQKMKTNFTVQPKTAEKKKRVFAAKPVRMTQEQRKAFRRDMMAKYSKILAYLGR